MSSNTNTNTKTKPIDQRALWDETARGVANTVAHIRTTWYGEEAVYYQREQEKLAPKYVPPFVYGAMATGFLFVNFRVTGHPAFQRWRDRMWSFYGRRRTTLNQTSLQQVSTNPSPSRSLQSQRQGPTTITNPPPPQLPGYLETKRKTEMERALKSMKLLTDLLVSISVGVSGIIFMLVEGNRDTLRQDFEEAPLVAGRSVVAEQMCPQLLKGVSLMQQESQETQDVAAKDPNLAALLTFVSNCRKRADYEDRVREERGLPDDAPVMVPHSRL